MVNVMVLTEHKLYTDSNLLGGGVMAQSTVPANDGLRPDNRNRAKDGGEPMIKPNKQKTIGIVEVRSFRCPPAKHIDLLP